MRMIIPGSSHDGPGILAYDKLRIVSTATSHHGVGGCGA